MLLKLMGSNKKVQTCLDGRISLVCTTTKKVKKLLRLYSFSQNTNVKLDKFIGFAVPLSIDDWNNMQI